MNYTFERKKQKKFHFYPIFFQKTGILAMFEQKKGEIQL